MPELDPPEASEHIMYLFEWFLEVSGSRGYGANGPQPISFRELQAWAQMTNRRLHSFEVDALKRLDQIWINIYYK